MQLTTILFSLIKYELFDVLPSENVVDCLTMQTVKDLYSLSKYHDLSHIVGSALNKLGKLDSETSNLFSKDQFIAMMRHEQTNHEYDKIINLLNDNDIKFIPLKGAVIKKYYKLPYQRTTCDIDILVEKDNIEKATDLIVNKLNYSFRIKTTHDVSLVSKSNVVLELHYTLVEKQAVKGAVQILSDAFSHSKQSNNLKCLYEMSNEAFYLYHIIHIAKHFLVGGTGIKPFIDGQIILNNFDFDLNKRDKMLEESGLLTFAKHVELLQEVWFSNKEHTPLTLQMEEYILNGGTYGNLKNNVAIRKTTKKSKFSYIMSRIFKPYSELVRIYPNLEKRKWLIPYYQVKRWVKFLFSGFIRKTKTELKLNSSITEKDTNDLINMLNELKLL